MSFFSDRNLQYFMIDGIMSPAEQELDLAYPRWMGFTGPQGTYIQISERDPAFTEQARVRLYYRDDSEIEEPPEEERGQTPGFGVEMDLANLKKGAYEFSTYTFFLEGYQPGDEKAYLNIIDHPLQYTIRTINPDSTVSKWGKE